MKKIVTILMMLVLLALPFAIAATPTGGQVTTGTTVTGIASTSQTVGIEGGNITLVNVTGTSITGNWGGFFGNISGGLELSDASSNTFYEWSVTDLNGAIVYAVNTTTTFGSLAAATNANQPSYINGVGTDNWTNTFATSEAFSGAGFSGSTPYVTTNSTGGTYKTYSLYDSGDSALVYAAIADDNGLGFNGAAMDFQMLVPATTGATTYNFYLELP